MPKSHCMKNKPSSFLSTDTPFVIPFNHFISAFVVNLVGLHLLDKKFCLLTSSQSTLESYKTGLSVFLTQPGHNDLMPQVEPFFCPLSPK